MGNLLESAESLRKFVDSAEVYIYVVDRETDEILMVNDFYARTLGVARERMEGHRCWEFVMGPDEGPCPFCPRNAESKDPDGSNAESRVTEAFNPTLGIWGRCMSRAVEWSDGRPAHIITVIDVSNEKLLREELSRLAYYDRYTNLPNRAKLEKDLDERPKGNYCLIAYDYISMRHVNDAYGRSAGDALMKTVIEWIRSFNLQRFEIYRVDGDEFCLLFDYADMMSAGGLADRIFERFREPWEVRPENEKSFIFCKIALCVIDGRTGFEDSETIMSIIERTLRISKETGAVSLYDRETDMMLRRELELEIRLKDCVMNGMMGFEVRFQPIADPKKGVWLGVEALCRWESPGFGSIPPLVFIRIAEQIGLINTIGYWVLEQAVSVCARLNLHEAEDFFLDVNLSPAQISDEALVSNVLTVLRRNRFSGRNLVLEITESEELETGGYARVAMDRLSAAGIKTALDDFGTGYSNFNNLKNLPVRILKTEKQFIDDIATNEYQQHLSYLLAELAHVADMKLIAEGVETKEQMKRLMESGADYYQGYLFSEPLTEGELLANIEKFRTADPIFEEVRRELIRESA
ncbi:MAG: EAL domain-containing protein [Clostridiales Family XIII bacterium]|nr:EAL domain-containing protein [Clostridiales Family XIII bacterium]